MKYFIIKLFMMLRKSYERFSEEKGFIISNGLAFKTLFAIIPIFALIISFTSIFPAFSEYQERLLEFILKYMLPGSVEKITDFFNKIMSGMKVFSIIGIVGTLYITLDLFVSLDNVLNKIWATTENRPIVQKILIYWSLLTAAPIFFALYFYYSTVVRSMVIVVSKYSFFDEIHYTLFSFLILEAFVFFIYYVIPNTRVDFKKALAVSLIVSFILSIFRFIFNYYTRIVITTWILYGSISVVIFFMIWVSLNWAILLLGAEFLSVYQNRLYKVKTNLNKYFLFDMTFILLVIYELKENFTSSGSGISIDDIVAKYSINAFDADDLLREIENCGFILRDPYNQRCYHLKVDTKTIKLSDIEKIIMKNIMSVRGIPAKKYNNIIGRLTSYYYTKNEDISIDEVLR